MTNELNARLKELEDWKRKYADLETQFNQYKSSSGGDLDKLNALLRDRLAEIERLKTDLANKTRDYDDLLSRFNALRSEYDAFKLKM